MGETRIWNGEAIEGFVVKFNEPYTTYRVWREITKKLLSAKDSIDHVSMPKNKMTRPETKVYVRYLDWLASEEGKKGIKTVEGETKGVKTFRKTIIVPVAIPGCGMSSFFFSRRKLIF